MPFALSSLGAPDASLTELLDLARARDVAGLELRAAPDGVVHTGLTSAQRDGMRSALQAEHVRVIAVASYLRVCEPGDNDAFARSLDEHLELARDLAAAGIRLFPGPGGAGPDGDERAVRRLAAAVPRAAAAGVRLMLETHDSHPRGTDIAAILHRLDDRSPGHGVGVIWDALHPWRAGEPPATTWEAIAPWFAYVQIKDADAGTAGRLRPVGDGAVPLGEIAGILAGDPECWWSLEWEKQWHPELDDLPVALDGALAWYWTNVRHHAMR